MKRASVAPYIRAQKRKLEVIARQVIVERTDRYKSSVFTMPEFLEWDKMIVVHFGNDQIRSRDGFNCVDLDEFALTENSNASINAMILANPAKVIYVALRQSSTQNLLSIYNQISSNQNDLIYCDEDFLAMSFELFFLAQGMDELIENPKQATQDLAIRAELLGGTLTSSSVFDKPSGNVRRNVDKGRLIVNQGSGNFN